ncbi:DsbA family protein [Candidatus Pyrohabitans sp.]
MKRAALEMLVAGIAIGLALGYFAAGMLGQEEASQSAALNAQQAGERTLAYVDKNFLKPKGVEGRLLNTTPYGSYLYRVDIQVTGAGRVLDSPTVYVTRDGEILVLQQLNMSQPIKEPGPQRVAVSEDDDPAIGPGNAPIVIIEFSDYQCPFCRKFRMETLDRLLNAYEGRVRFVYRDFPLENIHAFALKAAEAANCAGEQGKYFEYHDLLFEKQSDWSARGEAAFFEYAQQLSLNVDSFKACLASGKYEEEVRKDLQDGINAGVTGTPAFFINGIPLKGAQSFEAFKAIIDAELAGQEAEP